MKTKLILFVIAVAITGLQTAFAQNTSTQLDGKKYKIELVKEGSSDASLVRTVMFTNGKFQTPDYTADGFKEAVAFIKSTEDFFTWSSTIAGEKGGAMAWQGSVKGDKIEGSCVLRTAGAQSTRFIFKGTEIKATTK